jgi:hypothetical protein
VNRWKLYLLLVVVLATALSLPVLLKSSLPNGDSCTYMRVADNLLAGKGPVGMTGKLETRWSIGYPLTIAFVDMFVHNTVLAAKLAAMIATVLTVVFLALMTKNLFGPEFGLVTGVVFALSNSRVKISGIALSEPLFVFCIVCALYLWTCERKYFFWPRAAGVGLLLGWAYLARPEGLLLAGVLFMLALPIIRLWSVPCKHSYLISLLAFSLVAVSWIAFVKINTGAFAPTQKADGQYSSFILMSKSDEVYLREWLLNKECTKIAFPEIHESVGQLARRMISNAVAEAKWLDRAGSVFLLTVLFLGISLELHRKNKVLMEAMPVCIVAGLPLAYLILMFPAWRYVYTGSAAFIVLGCWQLTKRFRSQWHDEKGNGLKRIGRYAPLLIICFYLLAMDAYTIAKPPKHSASIVYQKSGWLKKVIPANDKIVIRQGELAYYAGLNYCMMPNNDMSQIIKYADYHDVKYIVMTDDVWHYNKGWGNQIARLLDANALKSLGKWNGPCGTWVAAYKIIESSSTEHR